MNQADDIRENQDTSLSNFSADEYLASIRNKNQDENEENLNDSNSGKEDEVNDDTATPSNIASSSPPRISSKSPTDSLLDDINNKSVGTSPKEINNTNKNNLTKVTLDSDSDSADDLTSSLEMKSPTKSPKRKKKKQISPTQQFDPEKYQNRKPRFTAEQDGWPLPKKKPQKEILEMVTRLSKPAPRPKPDSAQTKKKTVSDLHIFDRLYEMSTEKEKKNEEKRIEFLNKENDDLIRKIPKSNKKSQILAEKKLLRFVDEIFTEEDLDNKAEISQTELYSLLIKLGLMMKKENVSKSKLLFEKIGDLEIRSLENGDSIYDHNKLKKQLISAVKDETFSQFDRFAKQRVIIALSNSKNKKAEEMKEKMIQEQEQLRKIQEQKKINYDSIVRLSKTNKPPSPRKVLPKRPKFVQNPYSEDLEPVSFSVKTEQILEKSLMAKIPFNERNDILADKKSKKLEEMNSEINKSKLMKFEHKPHFSKNDQKKLEEYREKKKNSKQEEQPYHPSVINYNRYRKTIRKQMIENVIRPEGWEDDITRHRVAYQKYLQLKKNNEDKVEKLENSDIVSKLLL